VTAAQGGTAVGLGTAVGEAAGVGLAEGLALGLAPGLALADALGLECDGLGWEAIGPFGVQPATEIATHARTNPFFTGVRTMGGPPPLREPGVGAPCPE